MLMGYHAADGDRCGRKKGARAKLAAVAALIGVAAAGTYASYVSTGTGGGEADVAKWAVSVNGTDITAADTFDLVFQEEPNDHVVDGKVAPGSRLYADIEVDPSGSEVAVDYAFSLGELTASTGAVPDGFQVSKVCLAPDGGPETEITATGGEYSGTIALPSQSQAMGAAQKVKARVYVEWADDGKSDASHTETGKAAPTLTIPVSVEVSQHVG